MRVADLKPILAKVAEGNILSSEEAKSAFDIIMSGEATPSQIGAFLMALRVRGETVDEIAGAVSIMRAKMTPVSAPADAIDIVGTGGDASGSYNISTCSALVVAGCGVSVAKHGNRSLSSKSGASEVLEALGVNIDLSPAQISMCIREAGIGFMFAPAHHSAMRHVGPTRVELGTRTIFNLLGPLSNPASVKRYMIGVFAEKWVEPIAAALANLGAERAFVVHGLEGLDELSISGPSKVAVLKNGSIEVSEVVPADAGLDTHPASAIKGGLADENAAALRGVLSGDKNAYRDIVCLNAGAALMVAGKADSLAEGAQQAGQSIDSGAAAERLEKLVAVSRAHLV